MQGNGVGVEGLTGDLGGAPTPTTAKKAEQTVGGNDNYVFQKSWINEVFDGLSQHGKNMDFEGHLANSGESRSRPSGDINGVQQDGPAGNLEGAHQAGVESEGHTNWHGWFKKIGIWKWDCKPGRIGEK
ncbi:hypothetical protein L6452_17481 [Arctium lappa]|uniref:Uncharacterized protein n=1 Tax=Arctium lappa TaxID=4217 RepID=A0ACB9C3D6_ARCLA|nr:hypothetical protein L6452_17481 [Arctium lappa]